MYLGVGFLGISTKTGIRAAQIAGRIEASGKPVTKAAQRFLTRALESGDPKAVRTLTHELEKIAHESGVSIKNLGKTSSDIWLEKAITKRLGAKLRFRATVLRDRAAQQEVRNLREAFDMGMIRRQKETFGKIVDDQANALPIGEGTKFSPAVTLPSTGLMDSVGWAARRAATSGIRPGIGVNLLSPTGFKRTGFGIPLPRDLSIPGFSYRFLREGSTVGARATRQGGGGFLDRIFNKRHERIVDYVLTHEGGAARIKSANTELAIAKRTQRANSPKIKEAEDLLKRERLEIDKRVSELEQATTSRLAGNPVGGHATLGDFFAAKNSYRVAHEMNQAVRNLERQFRSQFRRAINAAYKEIGPEEAERVRWYVEILHGRSGQAPKELKLTKKEMTHAENIDKLAVEFKKRGLESGVLARVIADEGARYFPRTFLRRGQAGGARVPADETIDFAGSSAVGSMGRAPGDTLGRSEYELSSMIPGPHMADDLQRLWDLDYDTAARLADEYFEQGKIRSTTDLLARELQRLPAGGIPVEELTGVERQALGYEMRRAKDNPARGLFQLADEGEAGIVVKLADTAENTSFDAFDPHLFANMPGDEATKAKLVQVREDLDRIATRHDELVAAKIAGDPVNENLINDMEHMAWRYMDEQDELIGEFNMTQKENYHISQVGKGTEPYEPGTRKAAAWTKWRRTANDPARGERLPSRLPAGYAMYDTSGKAGNLTMFDVHGEWATLPGTDQWTYQNHMRSVAIWHNDRPVASISYYTDPSLTGGLDILVDTAKVLPEYEGKGLFRELMGPLADKARPNKFGVTGFVNDGLEGVYKSPAFDEILATIRRRARGPADNPRVRMENRAKQQRFKGQKKAAEMGPARRRRRRLRAHERQANYGPAQRVELPPNTEVVSTNELRPFWEFDRTIDEGFEFGVMRQSISDKGITEPIWLIYNPRTQKVWIGEGNHRLKIADELGIDEVPVKVIVDEKASPATRPRESLGGATAPKKPAKVTEDLKPSDIGIGSGRPATHARQRAKPHLRAEEVPAKSPYEAPPRTLEWEENASWTESGEAKWELIGRTDPEEEPRWFIESTQGGRTPVVSEWYKTPKNLRRGDPSKGSRWVVHGTTYNPSDGYWNLGVISWFDDIDDAKKWALEVDEHMTAQHPEAFIDNATTPKIFGEAIPPRDALEFPSSFGHPSTKGIPLKRKTDKWRVEMPDGREEFFHSKQAAENFRDNSIKSHRLKREQQLE